MFAKELCDKLENSMVPIAKGNVVCGDNRFKIIEKVKNHLIESTNITQKELEKVKIIVIGS